MLFETGEREEDATNKEVLLLLLLMRQSVEDFHGDFLPEIRFRLFLVQLSSSLHECTVN